MPERRTVKQAEFWTEFARLIRMRADQAGLRQIPLAEALSEVGAKKYSQTEVGNHLKGRGLGLREVQPYMEVLNLSEDEVIASLGLPTPRTEPSGADFNTVVDNDPTLDDRSKQLLKEIRGSFQAAAAARSRRRGA